jgi:hypothetical protein
MEITALALLTASLLALLQIGVTEWEWRDASVENLSAVLARTLWAYPVVVLVVGVAHAQLAVCITRLLGAATAVAVAALAIQIVFIALARSALPPGPMLASHALIVLPSLALDLSYFLTRRRAARGWPAWAVGSIAYTLVFCTLAFPAIEVLLLFPSLDAASRLETLVMGLVGALLVGAGAEWTGNAAAAARANVDRRALPAAKPW